MSVHNYLLILRVIYKIVCLDAAHGRMNGAPSAKTLGKGINPTLTPPAMGR